jgi:hypothetical protein
MPIGAIASIVAVYVAVAVLLLSLNLFSRWRWWVKAGAIVISGLFFIGSYFSIAAILGLPTRALVPERFSLVATRTVEPNQVTGDTGAIFLWLEPLNEQNVPSGVPVSYQVGYTNELAEAVDQAQSRLNAGEAVEGSLSKIKNPALDPTQPGADQGQTGSKSTFELPANWNILFNGMPPVELPEKGVL